MLNRKEREEVHYEIPSVFMKHLKSKVQKLAPERMANILKEIDDNVPPLNELIEKINHANKIITTEEAGKLRSNELTSPR